MPNNHKTRYLDSGACENDNETFLRCAMEPHECSGENENFSPHDQDTSIMRKCNPNNTPMGRCLSEQVCALRASDCPEDTNESNYDADDTECTYQRDRSLSWNVEEPAFTQFGSCYNAETGDYFCILNPAHCDESGVEVYKTPAETTAAGQVCDCSKVHVYGCEISGRVMCAVSQEACNQEYWSFLSPYVQRYNREMNIDGLDCILCKMVNTVEPTPSPTKEATLNPTKGPTFLPSLAPMTMLEAQALTSVNLDEKSDMKESTVILSSIFGAFGGIVIIGVIYMIFFRKRNEKEYETSTKKDVMRMEISY